MRRPSTAAASSTRRSERLELLELGPHQLGQVSTAGAGRPAARGRSSVPAALRSSSRKNGLPPVRACSDSTHAGTTGRRRRWR